MAALATQAKVLVIGIITRRSPTGAEYRAYRFRGRTMPAAIKSEALNVAWLMM